jgi:hypothetical protein
MLMVQSCSFLRVLDMRRHGFFKNGRLHELLTSYFVLSLLSYMLEE